MNFYKSNCFEYFYSLSTYLHLSIHIYRKNNGFYDLNPFLSPSKFLSESEVFRISMLIAAMNLKAVA